MRSGSGLSPSSSKERKTTVIDAAMECDLFGEDSDDECVILPPPSSNGAKRPVVASTVAPVSRGSGSN
eukprot:3044752-Prymnesium_polylepis.1